LFSCLLACVCVCVCVGSVITHRYSNSLALAYSGARSACSDTPAPCTSLGCSGARFLAPRTLGHSDCSATQHSSGVSRLLRWFAAPGHYLRSTAPAFDRLGPRLLQSKAAPVLGRVSLLLGCFGALPLRLSAVRSNPRLLQSSAAPVLGHSAALAPRCPVLYSAARRFGDSSARLHFGRNSTAALSCFGAPMLRTLGLHVARAWPVS